MTPPPPASVPQEPSACTCKIFYPGLAHEPDSACPVHGKPTDQELLTRFTDELDFVRQQLRDSQAELAVSIDEQTRLRAIIQKTEAALLIGFYCDESLPTRVRILHEHEEKARKESEDLRDMLRVIWNHTRIKIPTELLPRLTKLLSTHSHLLSS